MRCLLAAIVCAGCHHDSEVVHAAEVFCRERANEWAQMANDYEARARVGTAPELSAQADATYGILAPDARRVWAGAASSSFAFCLEIRVLDPSQAQVLEHAFAEAHAPFLQANADVEAQARQLAAMTNVLRDLNRHPARD